MDFLPLYFQLQDKPCIIIGGGSIALRKANLLHKSGATIDVVAHEVLPELQQLVASTGGSIRLGDYSTKDIDGKFLIIAATDDHALNKQVSEDAHQRQVPVNVVDSPDLCSVILPAIIDRSPLVIAVSSH